MIAKTTFSAFSKKYMGKLVNPDRVYGPQCVDLIKQYAIDMMGVLPGAWGNAIDYANRPSAHFLKYFTKVSEPQAGDVVVFGGGRYGHIALVSSVSGGTLVILEQNGAHAAADVRAGDQIRLRHKPKSHALAYYRPNITQPTPPKPAPAPADTGYEVVVVQPGWGVSHVAKAAGFTDWKQKARWNEIARLNGLSDSSQFKLQPNQQIRVRKKVQPTPPAPAPKPVDKPVDKSKKIVVQKGWGISHVAKAAGYEDYRSPERWNHIARLNGHKDSSTFRLFAGQTVIAQVQPVEAPKPVEKPKPVSPAPEPKPTVEKQVQELYKPEENVVVEDDDDDELFNLDMTLDEKKAYNKLTLRERLLGAVSWVIDMYDKIRGKYKQKGVKK